MASVIDWLEKDCYIPVSMSEFLQHLVNERMQNFCNIQCMSGHSVSVTFCDILRYLVNEWLQNFCDTQWMSCCRISATPSVWVVAEFLQHLVNEWLQNFCDTQWMSGRRISAILSEWVVTEFSLILSTSLITYLAIIRPFMRFTTNYGFRPSFRSAVKVYNIHISGLWYIVLTWVITSILEKCGETTNWSNYLSYSVYATDWSAAQEAYHWIIKQEMCFRADLLFQEIWIKVEFRKTPAHSCRYK